MIPVYNCYDYLRLALRTVLSQDPGGYVMQVAVIDDCSTDGDVAALVLEMGEGRVEYFRQPENVGSLRNFQTCLDRSRGRLVHILHGDENLAMPAVAAIGKLSFGDSYTNEF